MKRTALVTGASRGLGAAIATELAAAGMQVAVNYFKSSDEAEKVCQSILAAGGKAEAFCADVRTEDEVAYLVEAVRASFGEIDCLVLNATGYQPQLSIEEQTWQSSPGPA
jgi:3-oxoacyl-[acyl-carrier protein] reductase